MKRVRNKIVAHKLYSFHYSKFREWLEKNRNVPCVDCGNTYPGYVMQFDHTRGIKIHNVAHYRGRIAREKELRKCDVVCANCHAIRTYKRKQHE